MLRLKLVFFAAFFLLIATRCGPIDGLEVVEASYGANCEQSNSLRINGNMTSVVLDDCEHRKGSCTFNFTLNKLKRIGGDPAIGCTKDLLVKFKCNKGDEIHTLKVEGEALYKTVVLQCPFKVN
jgi:hypothetical protein